ncbi:Hypothetical predicted protein [Octopus vulgaris]|uniref:HD domain-containing protein n=1 Tax=Octopus vulgaris TaxID=6645 RepID=A0AA36BA23_OCTVU|nr:Hypothetical predicted protein [Octopus vulgaris]
MIRHLNQQKAPPKVSERDILCVEIAGLCHDLGHAPFSHVFEGFINENRRTDNKWKHEDASCQMLDHLLKENPHVKEKIEPDEIAFIKRLIIGESGSDERQFLYQIINNASYNIDVDKWDYLARDSHFLGIGKSFDHERMIKMSRVIDNEICYRDKTVDDFYDMFYSRYRLHKTAYQHKTVLLFNKLLGEAFKSADKHLKIFEKVDDMKKFTYFTDSILEEILKNEDNDNLKEARNKLKDIIYRSYEHKRTVGDGNDQGKEPDKKKFCDASINYGAGEGNPLEKIPFYHKNDNKSFKYISSEEVKLEEMLLLPKKFCMNTRYYFQKESENPRKKMKANH